ncbi:MAG: hypothetical protein ACTSQJ_18245 [Promethearchaeota archaeon]
MTGWEDFIEPYDEKIKATFYHKEKRLKTVIGMTENRSFLYKHKKTEKSFLSSKSPITTIEYYEKKLNPIFWIISIALLIAFGIGIIGLIICYYFRKYAIVQTYIGNEYVMLRIRHSVEKIVEFIRIVHSPAQVAL